jgi:cobalt-zinc-cadmium efflux system outer membrane protein
MFTAQNPDVACWMTDLETRQAAVAVEESKSIPSLTVSGGVRYARDTTSMSLVAGVSLPLPIFDRNQGSILEARHRVAQADYERQAAAVRTHAALVEAYQALTTAYTDITTLRQTILPATQRAFEATTEGYRQGKLAFLDIVDAQRTFFETRGTYLEALATYHKAVADVEQLIGVGLQTVTSSPPPRQ